MANIQDNKSASTLAPSVPPPPAEVKVRTMRSDIDGIAKAGGGLPQFKTVAVEGIGLPKSRIGDGASSGDVSRAGSRPQSQSKFPIWIVVVIVIVFVIILGFGWAIFLKK